MNYAVNEQSIDLSGLNVMSEGFARPGYHLLTVTKAEIKVVSTGARMIYLDFTSASGGKAKDRFTIQHPRAAQDEKAAKAQEIGLRKLKTLLAYGQAPAGRPPLDPNAFKGVSTLLGVVVGALVVQAPDFTGNKGDTVKGGSEVTSMGRPYYKPEEIAALQQSYLPTHPAAAPTAQAAPAATTGKAPF